MATTLRVVAVATAALTLVAPPTLAQLPVKPALAPVGDPPPPLPPAVIARDDSGRATVRAVRLTQAPTIDGRLDETIYETVPPMDGFIQQEPHAGEPATESTDVWIFFDDENIYVAARCWDSQPELDVVNELRRDMQNISQNENIVVAFDTFYDRRNGYYFQTTPLSAIRDQTVTDEGNQNESWNTIWSVKAGRFDKGWTMEMAIPFKSLRYNGSGPQIWGVNFRRDVKWKNESSYLTRVPAAYGPQGIYHFSTAATLVGLETPEQSRNLELKPYAVASLTTDRVAAVPTSRQLAKSAGFDLKYGLTRSLTADVSYNTDFAQVEEDVQQVNLTRFSLFFPEKRDFFLEGQGIFGFGGVQVGAGGGGGGGGGGGRGGGGGGSGGGGGGGNNTGDVPIMFFSRQVGISQGQSVPVIAGARLTGKAGAYGIGLVNIETDEKPSASAVRTNFTAVRLKRDLLRRSNVGIIVTRRDPGALTTGENWLVGGDANMAFFRSVSFNAYLAKTSTTGLIDDDTSYRTRFDYAGDRYGFSAEELGVGRHFNPEVGFVRRVDFARSYAQARFSPRPRNSRLVRKLHFQGSLDYVTDFQRAELQNREQKVDFRVDFQNSDGFNVEHTDDYEFIPQPFAIATNVTIPIGGYRYQNTRVSYQLGQQHRISGSAAVARGSFYGGTKTEVTYNGRGVIGARFSFEPSVSLNWVDSPYGDFTLRLIGTRLIVTPSPRMLVSSLIQFNAAAHTVNSSVRLRWEYTGGSELFLVYSEGQDTVAASGQGLLNRSFAVKVTRLFRF